MKHLFIALAVVILNATITPGATITWTNSAGGNWSNPLNWDANTVPGPGDTAFITLAGTYTVALDSNVTTSNLTVGGVNGTQTFNWNAASLVISNFIINSNASFNVPSGAVLNMRGTINNQGAINWGTTNALNPLGNCTFNNFGLFNLLTDFYATNFSDKFVHQSGAFTGVFNSSGTLLVQSNAGVVAFVPEVMYFTNSGTIAAGTNSTLALQAIFINTFGQLHESAPIAFNDGTVITGAGLVQNVNYDIIANGNMVVDGTFELDGNIEQPLSGVIEGTQVWSGAGIFNWNGGSFGAALDIGNMNLQPANTTTFSTNFQVNILASGGNVNSQILTNQGTIHWNQSFLEVIGNVSSFNNSGVIILQGGLFHILEVNYPEYPISAFNNTGTILATNNSYLVVERGWTFTNTGLIAAQGNATLDLESYLTNGMTFGDGTIISAAAGQVTFGSTGKPSYLMANGTITINGPTNIDGNFALNDWALVAGTQTWIGSGSVGLSNPTFQNGTVTISSNFQFNYSTFGSYLTFNGAVIKNEGTFSAPGRLTLMDTGRAGGFDNRGTLIMGYGFWLGPVPGTAYTNLGSTFNNSGTIIANQPNPSLWGVWPMTNSGTIQLGPDSRMTLLATPLVLTDGSSFTGGGTVQMNYNLSQGLSTTGPIANGTITVNAALSLGSLGILEGTQTWTGTGSFNWSSGAMAQTGTTTIGTGFHFSIVDDTTNDFGFSRSLAQAHVLNNQGTLIWNSTNALRMSDQSAFINCGEMILQTNSTLLQITPDCGFNNQAGGIVRVVGGDSSVNCPFTNSGTLDMELGTLTMSNIYALNASSVSQFAAGGPPTLLTVSNFNAAGTLSVHLTNGYVVTNGSQFTLIHYGAHSGNFANLLTPAAPGGLEWQLDFEPTALILEAAVVPAQISAPTILPNGAFQFTFNGPPGNGYFIQASSNLVDWVTLETNAPFSGQATFTDPNATNLSRQFYRGVVEF